MRANSKQKKQGEAFNAHAKPKQGELRTTFYIHACMFPTRKAKRCMQHPCKPPARRAKSIIRHACKIRNAENTGELVTTYNVYISIKGGVPVR